MEQLAEGVTHCQLGMLRDRGAEFAPRQGSLSTVKTNHKIVILFTGEKFITIMGGESKEKIHNSSLCNLCEASGVGSNSWAGGSREV